MTDDDLDISPQKSPKPGINKFRATHNLISKPKQSWPKRLSLDYLFWFESFFPIAPPKKKCYFCVILLISHPSVIDYHS